MKKIEVLKLLKEIINHSSQSIFTPSSHDDAEGNYIDLVDPYKAEKFLDEEMKKHEKEKGKEKKLNEL